MYSREEEEILVIYCQTTSVSAAHATHCATYCTPCRPLLRAFFRMDSNSTSYWPAPHRTPRAPQIQVYKPAEESTVSQWCMAPAHFILLFQLSARQGSCQYLQPALRGLQGFQNHW